MKTMLTLAMVLCGSVATLFCANWMTAQTSYQPVQHAPVIPVAPAQQPLAYDPIQAMKWQTMLDRDDPIMKELKDMKVVIARLEKKVDTITSGVNPVASSAPVARKSRLELDQKWCAACHGPTPVGSKYRMFEYTLDGKLAYREGVMTPEKHSRNATRVGAGDMPPDTEHGPAMTAAQREAYIASTLPPVK